MIENYTFVLDDGVSCRAVYCIDQEANFPKLDEWGVRDYDSSCSVSKGSYTSENTGNPVYVLDVIRHLPESEERIFIMSEDERLVDYSDGEVDRAVSTACSVIGIRSPVLEPIKELRREDVDDLLADLIFGPKE